MIISKSGTNVTRPMEGRPKQESQAITVSTPQPYKCSNTQTQVGDCASEPSYGTGLQGCFINHCLKHNLPPSTL
jgi:hypothetical protein